MPGQALFQALQGAARIDVTPGGEHERPQLPYLQPHRVTKSEMQLIDARSIGHPPSPHPEPSKVCSLGKVYTQVYQRSTGEHWVLWVLPGEGS
ncbi:MAG: hypothetical protein ACK4Z6_06790, partial [Candidatus Methylomirabilales bacterium]